MTLLLRHVLQYITLGARRSIPATYFSFKLITSCLNPFSSTVSTHFFRPIDHLIWVFTDRLPHVIESLQEGWLDTCKTSATVVRVMSCRVELCLVLTYAFYQQSALMSVLSAYLLVFVKDTQFPEVTPTGSLPFLILLSYGGLVFNISATVSAFLLTDRLGSMAINSSKRRDLARDGTVDAPSSFLLKRYGVGSGWTWSMWHCKQALCANYCSLIMNFYLRVFLCPCRTLVHHYTDTCLRFLAGVQDCANWDHLRCCFRDSSLPATSSFAQRMRDKGFVFCMRIHHETHSDELIIICVLHCHFNFNSNYNTLMCISLTY